MALDVCRTLWVAPGVMAESGNHLVETCANGRIGEPELMLDVAEVPPVAYKDQDKTLLILVQARKKPQRELPFDRGQATRAVQLGDEQLPTAGRADVRHLVAALFRQCHVVWQVLQPLPEALYHHAVKISMPILTIIMLTLILLMNCRSSRDECGLSTGVV